MIELVVVAQNLLKSPLLMALQEHMHFSGDYCPRKGIIKQEWGESVQLNTVKIMPSFKCNTNLSDLTGAPSITLES